jgi:hypothetical protein
MPYLRRHLVPGLDGADAGIGADDVQPAQLRDDPPVEQLDRLDGLGELVRCRHMIRNRLVIVADIDRDDVGALLRQPDGVAAALAVARARDEGDLVRYSPSHTLWLLSFDDAVLFDHAPHFLLVKPAQLP